MLSVLCLRRRALQTFTASGVKPENVIPSSAIEREFFGAGFCLGVLMCSFFKSSTNAIGISPSAGFMGVAAATASACLMTGAGLAARSPGLS
jgi:hypothetical protein